MSNERYVASLRQIEVLAPKIAYAVTVILTKEKGGVMTREGRILPGNAQELTAGEVEDYVLRRLNTDYDVLQPEDKAEAVSG